MCLTDAGICRLHYSSGRHWSLFVRVFTLHPPPPSNKFVSRDVQARPCPAQVDVRSITTLPTNKWLALYGPTEEKTAVLLDNDLWESQRRRSTTGASKEEFTRFSAAFYKDSPRSGPGRRRPPDGCGSASRSFFQTKKIRQETTGGLCQKKKSLGRWRYRRFTTCPVSHCVVYFNSVNTLLGFSRVSTTFLLLNTSIHSRRTTTTSEFEYIFFYSQKKSPWVTVHRPTFPLDSGDDCTEGGRCVCVGKLSMNIVMKLKRRLVHH